MMIVIKKKDEDNNENIFPVSAISNPSKVIEKLIEAEINPSPISCQWFHSRPPENIGKNLVFKY